MSQKMCLILRHFFFTERDCFLSEFFVVFLFNCTGTYEKVLIWEHHGQNECKKPLWHHMPYPGVFKKQLGAKCLQVNTYLGIN